MRRTPETVLQGQAQTGLKQPDHIPKDAVVLCLCGLFVSFFTAEARRRGEIKEASTGIGSATLVAHELLCVAWCFMEVLIDWHPAKNQLEKGKARFSFLLQIKRLRYDLAARPWAAKETLIYSALPYGKKCFSCVSCIF